jgi:hypothetical protein
MDPFVTFVLLSSALTLLGQDYETAMVPVLDVFPLSKQPPQLLLSIFL